MLTRRSFLAGLVLAPFARAAGGWLTATPTAVRLPLSAGERGGG
jgi:hypothetical protein